MLVIHSLRTMLLNGFHTIEQAEKAIDEQMDKVNTQYKIDSNKDKYLSGLAIVQRQESNVLIYKDLASK